MTTRHTASRLESPRAGHSGADHPLTGPVSEGSNQPVARVDEELPRQTRRLFDGVELDLLAEPRHRGFVIGRLLEDGDGEDLRWLFSRFGEAEVREWLACRGARKLSARSAGFWALLLGVEPAQPEASSAFANQVWPL